MKLLLHICCAPCAISCVDSLRSEGIEPTGYWDNPNIHPYTEYRSRKNALIEYADRINLPLREGGTYGLRSFVKSVAADVEKRCNYCYDVRMRNTARYAAENGYSHFSTTLFISPYQNHQQLHELAEKAAAEMGIALLYKDFRPLFRQGQNQARALGLYMQKYCGCIFSEEERYCKKRKV